MNAERQRYRSEPDRRFEQSREWRERIRPAQLAREPLCAFCTALGYVRAAATVDHIRRPRGNRLLQRDPANLQSLCIPHHAAKSAWERGSRARPLSLGTGLDGWSRATWTPETGIRGDT